MFRGPFNAIRDAVRKLFRPPTPRPLGVETKPTPSLRGPAKKIKDVVSRHQWAHGRVVRYSDRDYYVDHDGRFLRLKPGESPQMRVARLARS